MTWLQFVNVFFFQWFFIRLARCTGADKVNLKVDFSRPDEEAMIKNLVKVTGTYQERKWQHYGIYGFVVPCTGWWNDYIALCKPFYKQLTKKKYVTG